MCWTCCDCEVINASEHSLIMQCNGFTHRKPYVVMMGHLTEHYRWCSNWPQERINKKEKELVEKQNGNIY